MITISTITAITTISTVIYAMLLKEQEVASEAAHQLQERLEALGRWGLGFRV